MKETGILMTAPNVRGILEDRKTQTRRIIHDRYLLGGPPVEALLLHCRYGGAGDQLWVKETFFDVRPWRHASLFQPESVDLNRGITGDFAFRADGHFIGCHHWKPSIFMRRVESRIWLEVVEIRVERLQDISEEDARAEGAQAGQYFPGADTEPKTAIEAYRDLWESINGPGSWELNPWVWVIVFRRIVR